MYGEGISKTGELIRAAAWISLKAGARAHSYNDEKIGQGSEDAKKNIWLIIQKSLMKSIRIRVRFD